MLPPPRGPEQHGYHLTGTRIHDHRHVTELMHPVLRRMSRAGAVGLARLCGAAEDFGEREFEFCGTVRCVRADAPAPLIFEPLPELALPGRLCPPRDSRSARFPSGPAAPSAPSRALPTGLTPAGALAEARDARLASRAR